jgi:hypothetical protein
VKESSESSKPWKRRPVRSTKVSRYIRQLQRQHCRAFAVATADKLGYHSIAIAHGEGWFLIVIDKQKYNTVFIRGGVIEASLLVLVHLHLHPSQQAVNIK